MDSPSRQSATDEGFHSMHLSREGSESAWEGPSPALAPVSEAQSECGIRAGCRTFFLQIRDSALFFLDGGVGRSPCLCGTAIRTPKGMLGAGCAGCVGRFPCPRYRLTLDEHVGAHQTIRILKLFVTSAACHCGYCCWGSSQQEMN